MTKNVLFQVLHVEFALKKKSVKLIYHFIRKKGGNHMIISTDAVKFFDRIPYSVRKKKKLANCKEKNSSTF